jgi:hypothetical protein
MRAIGAGQDDPTDMKSKVAILARRMEMDRAVLFGLLSKVWALGAGPVSLYLIASHFSPEVQGYYYTFSTLLALQVFVELGIGVVIQQFSSHEWSKLRLDAGGRLVGDPVALARLSSIARIGLKWFGMGGALASLGLAVGGYVFFSTSPAIGIAWQAPWFVLCGMTGMVIFMQCIWSVLEGCNQVHRLYPFRFFQGIWSQSVLWIAIASGAELWTASFTTAATLFASFLFLRRFYTGFVLDLLTARSHGHPVRWAKDLFPMQWRIALSWLSGYFCFSLFVPVLFKFHGPVVAGRMGMTWTLVGVVGTIAGSWIAPKVPRFAMLAAERNYQALDRLFWRVTGISIVVAAMTALALFAFVVLLNTVDVPVAHRVASRLFDPLTVGLFLMAQLLLVSSIPFSSYMRAHKQEPIAHLSFAAAVMIGLSTVILGKYYAGLGVAAGYLIVHLLIIPLVIFVWYRRRREWMVASPVGC